MFISAKTVSKWAFGINVLSGCIFLHVSASTQQQIRCNPTLKISIILVLKSHLNTHTRAAAGLSSFYTPVATLLLPNGTEAHTDTQTCIPHLHLLPFISGFESIFTKCSVCAFLIAVSLQAQSSSMPLCCVSVCLFQAVGGRLQLSEPG